MMRLAGLIFLLFLTFSVTGQIVIGEEEQKKETTKKEVDSTRTRKVRTSDGITSIYFTTNWSSTNRSLSENGELYGEPLGERQFETSLNTWSFAVGLRNKIHKYIFWDGGLAFYKNGEQYKFTDVDTMFAYQTTYSYIAMPLRINFVYGNNIKISAGAGLVPQMFVGYRQEQQWETTTDSSDKLTIKTNSGYNPFVLSAIFNVGLTLDFQSNWSLLVSPEARIQLNTGYTPTSPYVHKARAYGISFGLIRAL